MYEIDMTTDGCKAADAPGSGTYAEAEDLSVFGAAVGGLVGYGIGLLATHFSAVDEKLATVCNMDPQQADYAVELGFTGLGVVSGFYR